MTLITYYYHNQYYDKMTTSTATTKRDRHHHRNTNRNNPHHPRHIWCSPRVTRHFRAMKCWVSMSPAYGASEQPTGVCLSPGPDRATLQH